jgi:phosphonate transport system ATP-binding protein
MTNACQCGAAGSDAIRAEGLWLSYPRTGPVLKGVTVAVPQGAFWAIFGASGAGKTTLLKVLAGLLKPERGRLEILGHVMSNGTPRALRRQLGYIPQQLGLVRGLTALENVLLGSLGRQSDASAWSRMGSLLGIFPREETRRAQETLELLGIAHKADEKAFRLSGGERQRVAIARTLQQGPRIIFADEFISDLDLPRAIQTLQTMRELATQQGMTFLVNLHEVEVMRECADRALVLKGGAIVHQGPAREISNGFLQQTLQ